MKFLYWLATHIPGLSSLFRFLSFRYTGNYEREMYPRGHYHSPLPDIAQVHARAAHLFREVSDLGPSIDLRAEAQLAFVKEVAVYAADFDWPQDQSPEWRYYLGNGGWFPPGDGFMLHAMMRRFKPAQIIEVGSGHSSAMMLDTNERFLDSKVRLTFVEPNPERLNLLLRGTDQERYRLLRQNVEDLPLSNFQDLRAGDILFIDSSHVSRVGSDVNFFLFDVLPILQPGVLIHFHDILWPMEYRENRIAAGQSWNEAYLLHAFLQYNNRIEILAFNNYLAWIHAAALEAVLPKICKNFGGSIWLRKC